MIRKLFLSLICLLFSGGFIFAQYITTSELFHREGENPHSGKLKIYQDPAFDTLLSRYILAGQNRFANLGYYGMDGYRIQIYSSSNRNAREESSKARAEFINKYPISLKF